MPDPHQDDWRELCAAAANEPDSDKLFSLVNQILKVFDDHQDGSKSSAPVDDCD
ncbi:MAG TPA: hypothetical protein VH079_07640 [Terriglobales bacterium]|jgi:hypothetical protein|nr:hypothetical protein [Terriglobales bacterium]